MGTMAATLIDGLHFPEGPRWHDGRVWFSDRVDVPLAAAGTLPPSTATIGVNRDVPGRLDATIDALPLDAIGHVPWWPPDRSEVTLHLILVHMIAETDRRAFVTLRSAAVKSCVSSAARASVRKRSMASRLRSASTPASSRVRRVSSSAVSPISRHPGLPAVS